MIFGNPSTFAILIEEIPLWNPDNTTFHNGLFHYILNEEIYPEKLGIATLSIDINMLLDPSNALVSQPEESYYFSLPADEAFKKIYDLTYPESTVENEYPEQIFSYKADTVNITDAGIQTFALANSSKVRILAARTCKLTKNPKNGYYQWQDLKQIRVNEVILSRIELNLILENIKKYYSFLNV
ncbi:immunity 42 family protein [Orbaceae bacterium ESL0721]|nr:immunity 42 family protein [Orbaceae bacterium ESL0721]